MNSFYSIIYAGINPASGDKLAVGLFMRGADKPRFMWSKHRTALIRDLMGADAQKLLVHNLKALQRKAEDRTDDLNALFPHGEGMKAPAYELNEPYFEYLASYSNNLLTVGEVTRIDLEATDPKFNDLFRLLVDDRATGVTKSGRKDIDETKNQLKEKISSRVNWDAEITKGEIPGLLLPTVRLDFIGKNHHTVIGEVIDFEKREFNLEADIYKLDHVSHVLRQQDVLAKAFIIGDEPDALEHPQQHRAWQAVKASERIELVPSAEIQRVEDHLTVRNVQPWRSN